MTAEVVVHDDLDDELESLFQQRQGEDGCEARVPRAPDERRGAVLRLHALPDEVIMQVLQRATAATVVCRCAQTGRKFRTLCASPSRLWRRLFRERWGEPEDCRGGEHPMSGAKPVWIHEPTSDRHTKDWKGAYSKWHTVDKNWRHGACSVNSLEGHVGSVCGCAITGDTLVSVGEDASIKWWDLDAMCCNFSLEKAHAGPIWSLKIDGEFLVTSSSDCTVKLWHCGKQSDGGNGQSDAPMQCERVLRGHRRGEVWCCDITPDSIFSGGRDSVAKIWDRETGANYLSLESHTGSVFDIHAGCGPADAHSVLTCGGDGAAMFWDMRTGKPVLTMQGDREPIFTADVIDSHMVVTAGGDASAARYDLRSGRKVLTFAGHSDSIWDLHFNSLSNRLVTTGCDTTVRIWDGWTGEDMASLQCHLEPVATVTCDASRIVTGDYGGWLFIWDFNNNGSTCEYVQLMGGVR